MCAERLPTMGYSYLVGAVVSVCVVCDRLTPLPVRASGSTARWAFLRMYEEPGAHLLKAAALPPSRSDPAALDCAALRPHASAISIDRSCHRSRRGSTRRSRWVRAHPIGACQACGARKSDGAKLVVDHIKPVRHYWHLRFAADNLQVLCEPCNLGKGSWDQTDWRCSPDIRPQRPKIRGSSVSSTTSS